MKFTNSKFYKKFKANRGAVASFIFLLVVIAVALLAPVVSPYDPTMVHDNQFKVPPMWQEGGGSRFLLGTDDIGRDLLSRLIYGARISLGVGFLVVLLSGVVGLILGLLSGYFGGRTDSIIMRFVDILMAIPSILLAIVVVSILGPSLINGIIAVSIVALPGFIRLVRASVMAEKEKLYVNAANSFGASHLRQTLVHILPNILAPIIVQATLGFSDGILNIAALGFLGLGAQAPIAEWGTMLADSRAFIETSSWLVTLPGLCILAVVLSFNLLGDGLRDSFDPKLDHH